MKKQLLTLSLLIMGVCGFSQSTIWMPHNANIDTMMGTRWMDAVDSAIVWEVGYSRVHTAAVYNVFTRTQDGNTFIPGTFMPLSDTSNYNSANITAVNDSVAYIPFYNIPAASFGMMKKTMDRGVTWTVCTDTVNMFQTSANFPDWAKFYTNNRGLVLGDPNPNYFEVYHTYDGGTNWTRVPQSSFTPSVTPSGEYGITDVFETYGDHHLWFGTNHGGGTTQANHIYRSNDTGHTWVAATIAGLNYGVSGIAFRDSMHGFAWGYNTSSSTAPFVLKKTSDGGVTWTTSIQHNNVGIFDISSIPGRNGFISVGLDSSHAAYITSVTYDDGVNWTVLESGIQEAQRMIKVEMLDSSHAWAGTFSDNTNVPFGTSGMCTWMGPVIPLSCPLAITGQNNVCSGTTVTLTAGGTLGATYTWTPGAVTTNTISFTATSSQNYTVNSSITGCSNSMTYSLTVKPTPTVAVSIPNDTICNLNSTTMTASGATSYNWAPSTGLNSTTSASVIGSYTVAGTYTYNVIGTTNGCSGNAIATVEVLPCVGVNEVLGGLASIYPNPSHGNITIDFGKASPGTKVVITDMIGNKVYQSNVNGGTNKTNVDLSNMPKGMYMVGVSNAGGASSVRKLVIE